MAGLDAVCVLEGSSEVGAHFLSSWEKRASLAGVILSSSLPETFSGILKSFRISQSGSLQCSTSALPEPPAIESDDDGARLLSTSDGVGGDSKLLNQA